MNDRVPELPGGHAITIMSDQEPIPHPSWSSHTEKWYKFLFGGKCPVCKLTPKFKKEENEND